MSKYLTLRLTLASVSLTSALAFSGQFGLAETIAPNMRAQQIAERQSHLQKLSKNLEKEARSILNSQLKQDALTVIKRPKFTVIQARKAAESELMSKLIQEGLLDNSAVSTQPPVSIFPKEDPMAFIAAPGSAWPGHHSYPGGLLYHTYTNLMIGKRIAQTYQDIYGVRLRYDYIRLAAIWHDAAKTITLPWNADGSCAKQELQIAKTSAHHILGIAEALFRKYPTDFIVTLASAHSPPLEGKSLSELIGYLKAAAIIAGVSYNQAGLTEDGKALVSLAPIEAFINHLDDHDYVLTQTSITTLDKTTHLDLWKRNEMLSKSGDLSFYQTQTRNK
jgi:hypothetical protein